MNHQKSTSSSIQSTEFRKCQPICMNSLQCYFRDVAFNTRQVQYESQKISAAEQVYTVGSSPAYIYLSTHSNAECPIQSTRSFQDCHDKQSNRRRSCKKLLVGLHQTSTSSVFGPSSTSSTSAFGQPSQGQSAFGRSTFGQPASSQSSFGQKPATTSAFGQPVTQTSAFGQPAAQTSAFGQTSAPTSAFSQPATQTLPLDSRLPLESRLHSGSQYLRRPRSDNQPPSHLPLDSPLLRRPPLDRPSNLSLRLPRLDNLAQTSAFGQPAQTPAFGQTTQPDICFWANVNDQTRTGAFSSYAGGGAQFL